MNKNRLNNLLNEMEESAKSWMEDAEKRDDWNEVSYYEGQIKIVKEIKTIILNW